MYHLRSVSNVFWVETLSIAAYTTNQSTSRETISFTTSYGLLFGLKSNLSFNRNFGCRCWLTNCHSTQHKTDDSATDAILLGNVQGSKSYKLGILFKHAVAVSYDIHFYEDSFNGQHQQRNLSHCINECSYELNVENFLDRPRGFGVIKLCRQLTKLPTVLKIYLKSKSSN